MRKWGVVISIFYALIVLGVLIPAGIMLLSFGPSVLLLYKKRLESYERQVAAAK